MFWRFGGYANISSLDTILEKPDVQLEEILDESDLVQELKSLNPKLLEFLRDETVLQKLLHYVTAPKPAPPEPPKKEEGADETAEEEDRRYNEQADREKDEKTRLKYAFTSCEVLSSEAFSIQEAVMNNIQHLRVFWTFLDREPPLEPLQASYFTKVNETLLDKHTEKMMPFIKSIDGLVQKILKHIDCPMIMDLLLKIISMEKSEGGAGIVDWLHDQDLIPMLLQCLSPNKPASTQTASGDFIKALITISANASQNEQSCIGPNDLTRQLVSDTCINRLLDDMMKGGNALTVGVGIIIEVIRKNNSDYDPEIGTGVDSIPSSRDPIYLGTLLRIFATHVPDFMHLILHQTEKVKNEDGTETERKRELPVAFGGKIEPLGFDRFKTCELMAELLHCSNMGLLNEKGGERYVKDRDRERDRLNSERKAELQALDASNDSTAGAEGVVVEKAPLQVQNGGVEFSDDGMNEEEFEDVSMGPELEEKESEERPEEIQAEEAKEEKATEEEDIFVDEPLNSPPQSAADAPPAVAPTAPSQPAPENPVPAAIPADDIPPLREPPTEPAKVDESELPPPPPPKPSSEDVPEQAVAEDLDTKMEDAPPPPPPKDDPTESSDQPEKPTEEPEKSDEDVPRAPSPPPGEGGDDDETLRKDGRSLVAGLKAASGPSCPREGVSPERMNADLPPLPADADARPQVGQPQLEEENLLDMGSSPDVTFNEADVSARSFGSTFTEYQAMIESDLDGKPVVGDFLKMMFVEHKVVPTILDFFFRFPWNNFLHNVVYDVVQQVFNGPMEHGYNRALAVDLFVSGRITERIVEGQRASDEFEAQRKMRLGYMGHLTLIAEEVVKFCERHTPEGLGHKVLEKVSDPMWIEYVEVTLTTTRERDNAILGGVRPDMNLGPRIQAFNANANGSSLLGGGLDSIDLATSNGGQGGNVGSGGLLSGFGSSSDEEDDDMEHDEDDDEVARLGLTGSSDQFASYISQEITNVDKFGSSDEDDDDDDDMSFAGAPSEPPPPPPLPLNIRRNSSGDAATASTSPPAPENPFESVEDQYSAELADMDSSDEEEEDDSGNLLRRTHEAAKRELLEEEDDDDFVSEGVKALSIRSPPTTTETKEIAPGEFYAPKKGLEAVLGEKGAAGEKGEASKEAGKEAGKEAEKRRSEMDDLQKEVDEEVRASQEATERAKAAEAGGEGSGKSEVAERTQGEKEEAREAAGKAETGA